MLKGMIFKLFLLGFLFVLDVVGIRTIIAPRMKECFHTEINQEEAANKNVLESAWFVVEGGDRTIKIYGPSGLIFNSEHNEQKGFGDNFKTDKIIPGIYTLCFDNTNSLLTSKKVDYYFISRSKFLSKDDVLSTAQGVEFVKRSLEDVRRLNKEYKIREKERTDSITKANRSVIIFSVLLSCAILVVFLVQGEIIKRFFEKPKRNRF